MPESSREPFKYRFITISATFLVIFYHFRSDRSPSSSADNEWITPCTSYTCTTIIPFIPAINDILCLFHQPFTAPAWDFRFQMLIIGRYLAFNLHPLGLRLGLVILIEMTSLREATNRSIPGLFVSNGELWCVYVEVPRSLICTRRRGWSSWTSHRRRG